MRTLRKAVVQLGRALMLDSEFEAVSRRKCAYYFSNQIINFFDDLEGKIYISHHPTLPTTKIYGSKNSTLCIRVINNVLSSKAEY